MKQINSHKINRTKICLHYLGLKPAANWHDLVVAQFTKLQQFAAVASARIILHRCSQTKPEFNVSATLEVPGPDFHATAREYTLRAAILKVVNNLRRQMQSRKTMQLARRKNRTRPGFLNPSTFSAS
jgi:ribosome-associated translation inhibitor RaiA